MIWIFLCVAQDFVGRLAGAGAAAEHFHQTRCQDEVASVVVITVRFIDTATSLSLSQRSFDSENCQMGNWSQNHASIHRRRCLPKCPPPPFRHFCYGPSSPIESPTKRPSTHSLLPSLDEAPTPAALPARPALAARSNLRKDGSITVSKTMQSP